MALDRKTLVEAVGATVVYNALGGDEADNGRKRPKPSRAKTTRLAEQSVSVGTVNINQAPRGDVLRLKHITKARAKCILASRPFEPMEELVGRGLLPGVVLAPHRDRLTV